MGLPETAIFKMGLDQNKVVESRFMLSRKWLVARTDAQRPAICRPA
jgi:hypothetical protein